MRKPAAFLAHGSPMSALGGDTHAAALGAFGDKHPDARGILIISAHWPAARPPRDPAVGGHPLAGAHGTSGDKRPDARGILTSSAHGQVSRPLRVTAWDHMPLLYDFGGFSAELYRIPYPSRGG